MKSDNIIVQKSYAFALRSVRLYQYLSIQKKEFVLSKQLLRSGTSIGANIEETVGSCSEKEFISKLSISYKECRESKYWINLLTDTNYLTTQQSKSLTNDIDELLKIIGSIQLTMKNKIQKHK